MCTVSNYMAPVRSLQLNRALACTQALAAAVYSNALSGDERRFVRAQERSQLRDLHTYMKVKLVSYACISHS